MKTIGSIFFILILLVITGVGWAWEAGIDLNADKNISVLPIFLTIVLAGLSGGAIHALDNRSSHSIKLTINGNNIDTGLWGHAFIGIFGAFVAVSLIIAVFRLDLDQLIASKNVGIINIYVYLTAISVVGGYSGLKVISSLSSAAMNRLEKEVSNIKQITEETTETLETLKSKNTQKDKEILELKVKSFMLEAESHARNNDYEQAIRDIKNNLLPLRDDMYNAYLLLGLCEKRTGNVKEALINAEKSLSLKKTRIGYFNKICYLTLLNRPIEEINDNIDSCIKLIKDDITELKAFLKQLNRDNDLDKIKTQDGFKTKLKEIEKLIEDNEK